MVCLGTHPMDLVELFLYTRKIEFTPWSSKEQFMYLLSGCLKPSSYPLPIVIHFSCFFSFSHKDKRNNFLPLLFGCLKPFFLPISKRNTLAFVFNIPMKIQGRIYVLVFRLRSLSSSPQRKIASQSGLPQNIEWELKMNDLITLGKRGRWMKS